MKRIIAAAVFLCMYAGSVFPTTFDECSGLIMYFGKGPAVLHQKIGEYEKKLKTDSNDYYAELALGILYLPLAYPADSHESGALQKLIDYTGKFLAREPENPLALIYNGEGHGLAARDTNDLLVKIFEANKGVEVCDKAVKLAAGKSYEWNIRFLRANSYVNYPEFFKKKDVAAADYRFVETEYNKNTNDQYMEGVMGSVYFYLGEIEKSNTNMDKAVLYWKKSVKINTKYSNDSYEARKAKKELETFTD